MRPSKVMAGLLAGVAIATSIAPATAQPTPGKITSAGIIGGMIGDGRSNFYAGAENVNSLEVCKNFGLAIMHNFTSPYPQSGNLMCFDANKVVIAKFRCVGAETFRDKPTIPAYCTPIPIAPSLR